MLIKGNIVNLFSLIKLTEIKSIHSVPLICFTLYFNCGKGYLSSGYTPTGIAEETIFLLEWVNIRRLLQIVIFRFDHLESGGIMPRLGVRLEVRNFELIVFVICLGFH